MRESLRARRNGRLRNAGAVLAALAVACIGIWAWGVLRARSNEVNHIIEALRIAESNVQAALSAQSDIQRNARQEIDRIRNELTTATGQQKETLTKKLNAAESKYNEADSEKHTLVMQINSINRVDQTKIDDLEKRVKTLQGTVSSPTTDLGSAQRALEAAADPKELDRLKTENERLQAENKRLTEPWRETREELQFWKEIWDSRDPAVFEKYLGKYPMGMFSAVAKLRITQLPLKEELPEERSPKKQQPVRVGSRVQEAILIHKILPAYPILAKQARIQGQVSFNGIIGADGQIQTLDLASDPTNLKLLLLKASVDAIAQWRYKPTLVDGKPVAVKTQIDINFLLHY